MAHGRERHAQLKTAYVVDRLSLAAAAKRCGISIGTAARWKESAAAAGDDWDKIRGANLLAGGGVEAVARQMLMDYVVQHQAVIDQLNTTAPADLAAAQRAAILASLADAFNKTVSASRRILPETSELATAIKVLQMLTEFIARDYPQHRAAFVEVLEPFGAVLSESFK